MRLLHRLCIGGWGERKRFAHATACRAVGVNFISHVMKSLGGWSEEEVATIFRFGRLLGQGLGLPMSETTRQLSEVCYLSLEGECISLDPPSALSFSFCRWIFMTSFFLYFVLFYVLYSLFLLVNFLSCICPHLFLLLHLLTFSFLFVFCPHFSFHFSFHLICLYLAPLIGAPLLII